MVIPVAIEIGIGYEEERTDNDLVIGGYLWTGWPIWKRVPVLPFYLALVAYHCIIGQEVFYCRIKPTEDAKEKSDGGERSE
jgi:hypothetical protein